MTSKWQSVPVVMMQTFQRPANSWPVFFAFKRAGIWTLAGLAIWIVGLGLGALDGENLPRSESVVVISQALSVIGFSTTSLFGLLLLEPTGPAGGGRLALLMASVVVGLRVPFVPVLLSAPAISWILLDQSTLLPWIRAIHLATTTTFVGLVLWRFVGLERNDFASLTSWRRTIRAQK